MGRGAYTSKCLKLFGTVGKRVRPVPTGKEEEDGVFKFTETWETLFPNLIRVARKLRIIAARSGEGGHHGGEKSKKSGGGRARDTKPRKSD